MGRKQIHEYKIQERAEHVKRQGNAAWQGNMPHGGTLTKKITTPYWTLRNADGMLNILVLF
jgi:hypothetical protein